MLNFLNRGALVQLGLRVFLESLVVMVNKEILDPRDHREIGYNFLIHLHLLFLTVLCVGSRWNTRHQRRQW